MFALGSVGRGSSKAMVDKSRIIRRLSIDNTNNQMEIVCQNIEVNQEDVFFEDCKGLDLDSKNQESGVVPGRFWRVLVSSWHFGEDHVVEQN